MTKRLPEAEVMLTMVPMVPQPISFHSPLPFFVMRTLAPISIHHLYFIPTVTFVISCL